MAAAEGVTVLSGAAALGLKPFETVIFLRETSLSLHGVSRVRLGGLSAWEKDTCADGAPCACVDLVHGLGDSALTWDNILIGGHGAFPPPAGVRLVALELPGSEGSDQPKDYSVPALADAVAAALQTRCPRWTVVGNSLGGWISAWVALKKPALIERLILANAAGLADPTGALVKAARTLEAPTAENMKEFVARAYKKHEAVPERAWPAIVASIRARPTAKIVAALKEDQLLDARAQKIRVPTLVLWGADDGVVPLVVGRGFARLIPNAEFRLVPDCGHIPQQECPAAVRTALFCAP